MKKSILITALCLSLCACAATSKNVVQHQGNEDQVWKTLEKDPIRLLDLVRKGGEMERLAALEKEWEQQPESMGRPLIEAGRASIGPNDAPVTIVEYSNFLCSYCYKASNVIEELVEKTDNVRVIFKHMPHGDKAYRLALMHEALVQQSPTKAWEFGRRLFERQLELNRKPEAVAKEVLEELGVDMNRLREDMASDKVKHQIRSDMNEAKALGSTGTPTFFVNDIRVRGYVPVETLEKAVEEALKNGRSETTVGEK